MSLYHANLTSKGQITIPKKVREHLGLAGVGKVLLEPLPGQKSVIMRSAVDFLDIAERVSKEIKGKKLSSPRNRGSRRI